MLFKLTDMDRQSERFFSMLDTIVKLCGSGFDEVDLNSTLRSLGKRHAQYGVQESHYTVVGKALMSTLQQCLLTSFTHDVEVAWKKVYNVIHQQMVIGSASVPYPPAQDEHRERDVYEEKGSRIPIEEGNIINRINESIESVGMAKDIVAEDTTTLLQEEIGTYSDEPSIPMGPSIPISIPENNTTPDSQVPHVETTSDAPAVHQEAEDKEAIQHRPSDEAPTAETNPEPQQVCATTDHGECNDNKPLDAITSSPPEGLEAPVEYSTSADVRGHKPRKHRKKHKESSDGAIMEL
jgi:hypothetical protein